MLALVLILLIVLLKHQTLAVVLLEAREVGNSVKRLAVVHVGDLGQARLLLQLVILWLVLIYICVPLSIFIPLLEQPLVILFIRYRFGLLQS